MKLDNGSAAPRQHGSEIDFSMLSGPVIAAHSGSAVNALKDSLDRAEHAGRRERPKAIEEVMVLVKDVGVDGLRFIEQYRGWLTGDRMTLVVAAAKAIGSIGPDAAGRADELIAAYDRSDLRWQRRGSEILDSLRQLGPAITPVLITAILAGRLQPRYGAWSSFHEKELGKFLYEVADSSALPTSMIGMKRPLPFLEYHKLRAEYSKGVFDQVMELIKDRENGMSKDLNTETMRKAEEFKEIRAGIIDVIVAMGPRVGKDLQQVAESDRSTYGQLEVASIALAELVLKFPQTVGIAEHVRDSLYYKQNPLRAPNVLNEERTGDTGRYSVREKARDTINRALRIAPQNQPEPTSPSLISRALSALGFSL